MSSKPSFRAEAALFATPRRRGWRTAWRWIAAGLFVAWSLALLAWLILHWGILPRLDQWRPQIEQRVGQALGAPIRIGAIRVRSGGWVPALELDEVVVLDVRGEPALRLGRVAAALSPASLLGLQPRLAQLHLDGVELDLRRDAQGRLHIAGLALDAPQQDEDDGRALRWLFEQHEFVIRRGTLRWTDELRGAPPLQLADVDLVLRNDGRRHELRLDATPPPAWGDRFALRARLREPLRLIDSPGPPWADWRGTLYADLPRADLSSLGRHLTLPFELAQGRGALRAWVDIEQGQPVGASADLALDAVTLRLGPALPPLALSRVQGRATLRRSADSFEAGIEGLGFETDDGLAWPRSRISLALELAPPATAPAAPARPAEVAAPAAVAERPAPAMSAEGAAPANPATPAEGA
ncbi:MAG: TIGR02099 family protein, partial [Burkholderiales bacterium]|nr:TIGR02099 family protein [Burkholderiales bacterium]